MSVTQLPIRFPNRDQHPSVRTTDPDTCVPPSEPKMSKGRTLALLTHAEHEAGLTDFELADLTGSAQTSVGCRRAELVKCDPPLVMGTTVRRPSPSGAAAIVWKITPQGVAYARKLREETS